MIKENHLENEFYPQEALLKKSKIQGILVIIIVLLITLPFSIFFGTILPTLIIPVIVGIILLIIYYFFRMYIRTISYHYTDTDVRVKKGLITKSTATVPYRTITNLRAKRGPLDRYLGLTTLEIETAGGSGGGPGGLGPEEKLEGLSLEDFDVISTYIYSKIKLFQTGTAGVTSDYDFVEQPPTKQNIISQTEKKPSMDNLKSNGNEILFELREIKELLQKYLEKSSG